MKKFVELFKNALTLDTRTKKSVYDIKNWKLVKKTYDQMQDHKIHSMLKNL